MKFTSSALSTLLLAGAVSAVPMSNGRRMNALERREARRLSKALSTHPFPLAVNYTSFEDRADLTGTGKFNGDKFVNYDSNWAGAVSSDSGISNVQATITVPSVGVPSGGNSGTTYGGAAWVGIDGASQSCGTILQTGISWQVQGNDVQYAAWYEWYPNDSYNFNLAVNQGDTISMQVTTNGASGGTAYITNESTGQSVSQPFSNQQALCQATAEFIVEDFEQNGALVPFATFSPVTFTNAGYTNGQGNAVGVSGAQIDDIQNNNGQVMTNCGTSGSSQVQCSYTGGSS